MVVRYGSGRADSARTVAAAVPGAALVMDASLPANSLELVVGSSFHGVQRVVVSTPAATPTPTLAVRTGDQSGCSA